MQYVDISAVGEGELVDEPGIDDLRRGPFVLEEPVVK